MLVHTFNNSTEAGRFLSCRPTWSVFQNSQGTEENLILKKQKNQRKKRKKQTMLDPQVLNNSNSINIII